MAIAPQRSDSSGLPPFRFGLRQLFGFVALICVLLAAMAATPGAAAVVLLMSALVIAAHIFSTALGNRLRAHADQQILAESRRWFERHSAVSQPWQQPLWHRRGRESWGWLPRLVLVGAAVGLVGGGIFLAITIGDRTSLPGVVVGAVSLAVLAGWMAFLASSFYAIFRNGVGEAISNADKPKPAQRIADV